MCPGKEHHHDQSIGVEVADSARSLIEELVIANHILFDYGVVDAFGHISVRHDKDPNRFLLARNVALGRVTKISGAVG